MPKMDTIILGVLTGLTLVSVVVTDIVTGSIPEILAVTLTTLIGGTAGVAVGTSRSAASATTTSTVAAPADAALG